MGVFQPERLTVGTNVSLITSAQYRYDGTVVAINAVEGTLTLRDARFGGSENRVAAHSNNQTSKARPPAVGSMFSSITFWLSSIVRLSTLEDLKADLNDDAVVNAAAPMDTGRGCGRRTRSWWSPEDNRADDFYDPMNKSEPPPLRYMNPAPMASGTNQPRVLVSYPRRSRTGMAPTNHAYVPVVPYMSNSPRMFRQTAYRPPMRTMNQRRQTTPNPAMMGDYRMAHRRLGQPVRRGMENNLTDSRYDQLDVESRGGVFVYLPPEMAAAYQAGGVNLMHARSISNKKRFGERKTNPQNPEDAELDSDCKTPYDFETANAELEAELAKININATTIASSDVSEPETSQHGIQDRDNDLATSTGDMQNLRMDVATGACGNEKRVTESVTNGASGDSLTAENVPTSHLNVESGGSLGKGEYYVREKCFFDQISRSGKFNRLVYSHTGNSNFGLSNNSTYINSSGVDGNFGPHLVGNPAAAARRERQLNLETFGSIAVRTTYPVRRRPNGGIMSRDFLVQAPA